MAYIKGVNRSASVAFSPDSPYLAAGTMAGAVDQSFSSSANLEIFKLEFQSEDRELKAVGDAPSTERFNRLSWGKTVGSGSEETPLGLIAGGLVDGSITIWNPNTLISSHDAERAVVGRFPKHTGPVRGLEFNVNSPNLLASGAVEGEICIWDLANPAEPTHFPPLKSVGSGAQGEVSFLSWNHKVQHILASTSYNGTTVVWDLKRQKPVISFADSTRRRCSVLQWNPDVATQLIVASDDDSSPSLRLWDVRNTISPVKEFVGHTKGVIAMSWCPIDTSFLLTCAKDNRTICWDTVTGEIVCELPVGTNWNFDIHWYPKTPGLISASSFDGKIGIYNIEACSRFGTGEADFGGANLRAPKWLKRPVGASFGFGGKLVSFHPSQSSGGVPSGNSEIYVHSLVTEHSLVNRSTEFEAAIQNGEKSSMRSLCEKKSEESKSDEDRETWGFLKVMFEDDGTARTKLLSHLGFDVADKVEEEVSEEVNAHGLDDRIDKTEFSGNKEDNTFLTDNGEDFFNNLQSPKADTPRSPQRDGFVPESSEEQEGEGQSESNTFDESIQRALVVGDYKGAVSQCISANRMADALVIAHVGSPSLWESTRDQYLKKSHSSYLKVVYAMVNNDLTSLVNTRPLNSWKETLALLCTFAEKKDWTVLCGALASRLMAVGNTLAATLCYICAGNIDKTVEIWSRNLKPEREGKAYVDLLQDLMEKTIVLAFATGEKRFSASLSKLVENYAELLASQGLLTTAMEYLKLLESDESSQELAILRDRIALSSQETEEAKVEDPQMQAKAFYGTDQTGFDSFDGSQNYYQHQAPPQVQPHQNITGGYGDHYQQQQQQQQQQFNSSYGVGGGYATPAGSYQTPQAPHTFIPQQQHQTVQTAPPTMMFTPSQPVHQQTSFGPMVGGGGGPQAAGKFNPATPPALKNVEQYQQPTLGSHLYPGVPNAGTYPSASSSGSVPSQMQQQTLPHVATNYRSVPGGGGFAQRPGMGVGVMQPPSPTITPTTSSTANQVVAAQAVAPPAPPPPTVQTVDTSNVPAEWRGIVATLSRLFNETTEALGGPRANPAKKREIEDNSKKIGALFDRLNTGDISKNAADKLGQLCHALDVGDYGTAMQIQVVLTTSEWDECNFWLSTLKRMIKTRQSVRIN